ncbi:acetyl-CoA C-acetyltransferase [Nakamurella sp. YIM 132087]|uniref:Acetyl-CoA C-acetyltransferase n=1 Tax=Nakamurella alba TaxID=2665158 RepID=A0A7K1FT46_9ACTN|nr:acetyl-CoA C-acetyltransferase [Nakamurella alba]MTD17260.1 acetyl-CoA C-acetyltransferase [Nakamurella alba]
MTTTNQAYLVAPRRTPVGRRNGGLSAVHPLDLAGAGMLGTLAAAGVDPGAVDDVVFGCVGQIGPQTGNIARLAWLAADLPEHVPGVTIDRQCGSSQQAVQQAAQAVLSGTSDLVLAGGVESMSVVPIMSPAILGMEKGMPSPFAATGWTKRYGDQEISQFRGAELIAQHWGIERSDMEEYALRSHTRAAAAIAAGRFDDEIVPAFGVTTDEGPRPDTTLEKMAGLKPLSAGGRLTAAVSSQVSDGAAAVLVASERAVQQHGLTPVARVHTVAAVGSDPVFMLTGPIPATEKVLQRSGLTIDDIDTFEVNEAFASVVLAWLKETGAPLEKVNPNGGAIALGHPLGASGARLLTTMVHELRRTGGRYGLQVMCEGGGMANATIVEML